MTYAYVSIEITPTKRDSLKEQSLPWMRCSLEAEAVHITRCQEVRHKPLHRQTPSNRSLQLLDSCPRVHVSRRQQSRALL